jgi:phage tail sheath protein FI
VYIETVDKSDRLIRGVRTDVAGFVGLAERGPADDPVRIESWRQFQAIFGQPLPFGYLAYAVKGFFENGGRTCFVVRVTNAAAVRASLSPVNEDDVKVMTLTALGPGPYGNQITISISNLTKSEGRFSLRIQMGEYQREYYHNLSVMPDHPDYYVNAANEGTAGAPRSQLVLIEDLLTSSELTTEKRLPDPDKTPLTAGTAPLTNGVEDLTKLTIRDLLGDNLAPAQIRRGLHALDRVEGIGLVCIPDVHARSTPIIRSADPARLPECDPCLPARQSIPTGTPSLPNTTTAPPGFSLSDIRRVHRALIERCTQLGTQMAIIEPPLPQNGQENLTTTNLLAYRRSLPASAYASLYHPWIKVLDPDGPSRTMPKLAPPCGHVAGFTAATDLRIGPHRAPANGKLQWVEDLALNIGEELHGVLNPEGINCLRAFPGRGIRIFGARTLSSDSVWKYIPVRRLITMIRIALSKSTQWAVFEANNEILRQTITANVTGFLEQLREADALKGSEPELAYYVKCDESNNTQDLIDLGRLVVEVGVAPTVPGEFIIFRIGKTVNELETMER